jgi:predicted GIY-YIG superfamily endonuclease
LTRAKSDLAVYTKTMSETLDVSENRFYVYILFSVKDHKFYTGFTIDLKDRLSRHARGEVKSTKNRRPLKLIHYEYFIDSQDAKAREVFLKSGFGRNNLKKALQKTLCGLNF